MDATERFAWIQLALTPYIGPESFLLLLKHFGSASVALAAPAEQIRQLVRQKQAAASWENAEKCETAARSAHQALEWEQQNGCRLMLLGDEDFPDMLVQGITPPPLLFLRGNTELMNRSSVAVVGSRHATPQAMRIAHDFGQALSGCGISVVSGMAAGIDTAAHQGALKAGGNTVAVWGTGINRIYPPSNKSLAHQIAGEGLLVSEFPLDTRPLAGNFPRRNRLIAALSQAVLVVEAALESGSLITARLAAEMGREVMAVPGSIDNPHSKGCHKLIKEGAKLTECLDDILQECPNLLQNAPLSSYSINRELNKTSKAAERETAPASIEPKQILVQTQLQVHAKMQMPSEISDGMKDLLTAMGYDPVHPDSLAEQLNLAAADVYAQLLEWELEGVIAALPGGRYQRIS